MLREPVLNTKRLELGRCVSSRKRKLSELYFVAATVAPTATATVPPRHHSTEKSLSGKLFVSEVEFQDSNDLSDGRRFDVATLHRLPGGEYNYPRTAGDAAISGPQETIDSTPQSDAGPLSRRSTLDVTSRYSTASPRADEGTRADGEESRVEDIKEALSKPQLPALRSSKDGVGRDDVTSASPLLRAPAQAGALVVHPDKSVNAGSAEAGNALPTGTAPAETRRLKETHDDAKILAGPSGDRNDVKRSENTEQKTNAAARLSDKELEAPKDDDQSNLASRRRLIDSQPPSSQSGPAKTSNQAQKAPMRIDTAVGRYSQAESATPSSSFTPSRSAQAAMQSSPPERMTTRVSSGALRHKSVSEILGETPKISPSSGERSAIADLTRDDTSLTSRRTSFAASPDSATFKARSNDGRDREKDRSKLSTVVFARQQPSDGSRPGESRSALSARKEKSNENKDYLVPLFAAQAAAQNPSLNHLIASAHKTLTTANHYIDYHESQDCRILKRIYHLQNSNRWSLRQLERSAEPSRRNSHWDTLLGEVRWLRTDFREERKWKLTAARSLAEMCSEWVLSSPEVRPALQVKRRPISRAKNIASQASSLEGDSSLPDKMEVDSIPELVHSVDDETSDNGEEDAKQFDALRMPAPAALFSLGPGEVSFSINKTPSSDKLLSELPLFQPFLDHTSSQRPWSEILDAAWQKPIVPVSRHTVGKIVIRDDGPKLKRSRYEHTLEDECDTLVAPESQSKLAPEQNDVALFDPKNKHIVDRLHAGHAFRPPSQYPMPSQQFFESRNPSQWTTAEDDELRKLVREYEYNWNAISDFLTSPSLYSSGAERRTPWECFERWESFEGLPGEMDKHSYFRAWRSRKQNAKQKLEQGYLLQQQSGATGQFARRRSAEPMHVERRRSDKHYALIGAIAKVIRKRESHLQKQQHAAQIAAIRKPPETAQPRLRMQTPQEFSAHKHKQEVEFKEKQMLYRQQMENARRNALQQQKAAQQAAQQQQQSAMGLGVPPQARMGIPIPMNTGTSRPGSSMGQPITQPGNRPFGPSAQSMLNGMVPNGNAMQAGRQSSLMGSANGAMNVIPQAQMQSLMQGQHPGLSAQNGQEANRVMSEAMRLQEQQRMMQRQRAQPNGHNPMVSLPNGSTMTQQQMQQQNAAMLANLQHAAKVNAMNGLTPGQQRSSANSPMINVAMAQQLSGGMVPILNQISNQLRQLHPNASPEQIKQLATQNLNQHLRNQNAQVVNGMAANPGHGVVSGFPQQGLNFGAANMSPQMYAQILRSQQANQQTRMGGAASVGTNSSGASHEPAHNASSRPGSRGTPGSQARSSVAPKASSSSPPPPQPQVAGAS